MKKLILAALVAVPLAGLAQGAPPPGPGRGPGAGPGNGPGHAPRDPERLERRMRLARTLGLAEALDLDAPQALKLGDALAKFDERRVLAQKQLREAHRALRDAADSEKPSAQEVDQAIQKAVDARAQLASIDKETLQVVSKDLSPAQRARAVLFLDRFQKRFRGLGPDADEIRHVIKRRMGKMSGAGGPGRSFAFRMDVPPLPPAELALEIDGFSPPPPDDFLFDGGDDDEELEIERD